MVVDTSRLFSVVVVPWRDELRRRCVVVGQGFLDPSSGKLLLGVIVVDTSRGLHLARGLAFTGRPEWKENHNKNPECARAGAPLGALRGAAPPLSRRASGLLDQYFEWLAANPWIPPDLQGILGLLGCRGLRPGGLFVSPSILSMAYHTQEW